MERPLLFLNAGTFHFSILKCIFVSRQAASLTYTVLIPGQGWYTCANFIPIRAARSEVFGVNGEYLGLKTTYLKITILFVTSIL